MDVGKGVTRLMPVVGADVGLSWRMGTAVGAGLTAGACMGACEGALWGLSRGGVAVGFPEEPMAMGAIPCIPCGGGAP